MTSAVVRNNNFFTRSIGRWLRWLNSSVSHRISASVLALTLAVGGVIGWGSFLLSHKLVEEGISRDLAHEAALAARQVEFTLNTLYADLARLSSNRMLAQGLADAAGRDTYLAPFFKDYRAPARVPVTLTLHDAAGRPVAGTGDGALPTYERAPWLKRVINLGFTHSEIVRDGGARELMLARPLKAAPDGATAGILVMRVPLEDMFRSATSSVSKELITRLKTDRGELLAESHSRKLDDAITVVQPVQLETAAFPARLQLEIMGKRGELLEPLQWLVAAYTVATGILLLVVLGVSRRIGKHFTAGLARLTEATSSIASAGRSPAPLAVRGQDEVARLAFAINTMTERLNESNQELDSRVAKRTVMLEDINSALVKEILNHKKTGEQLHVAANAIENAAEGVMVCDAEERIVSVNKAFTRITGFDPQETLGKRPDMLLPPDQAAPQHTDIFALVREQGHWRGELPSHKKNGESYVEQRSVSAVRDDEGRIVNFIILLTDVTKQKEDEKRLHFLAHHDALTGLSNRILFQQRCEDSLLRASRRNAKVAVMFVDIDHFKTVNDSLGHAYGDELLKGVAARLQECTRKTDAVARLGGDEFTILLNEVSDSGDIAFIAKKILDRLSMSFTVAGHEIYLSASVGISCYPEDGQSASVLIKNADAAMFAAKEQGRNNYQFFSAEMNSQALEALMMASNLRLAVERRELVLEYQPRIDLGTGKVMGVEALVRWNHPNLGRIMPNQFIGIAEKTGLIDPMGEWVLREACEQTVKWRRSGVGPLRVAVNISARQFRRPDFIERIAAILDETGMEPGALEVELTESMVMHDPQRAAVILERLKERGVAVAIDDFGTGYSSLSYLKRFPIDYIKIDQSFIRGLPLEAEDIGITRAIVALAKTLDVRLIAEGVDNHDQLAFLKQEGCNEGQGYLISSSLPADALPGFLEKLNNTDMTRARLESRLERRLSS